MKLAALLLAAGLAAFLANARAVDPRQRTDSGQFTIYCDDPGLRRQIAGFAARTKAESLALIDESDTWRSPIVVTIELVPAAVSQNPVTFRVVDTVVGMLLEVVSRVCREPTVVSLHMHLIRAVLLEFMYRKGGPHAGAAYTEPPWWVVEGAAEWLRRSESGVEPQFFRTLIETNRLPPIESFLAEKPDELGPTALAVDRSLSMCLLQLLIEQPDGRRRLANLIRNWPSSDGDIVSALGREFPALAGGAPALQKWWTLNLARFAAADRLQALSAEETDRQISALLDFEIPQKDGKSRRFSAPAFAEYLKLPASRTVLATQRAALVALSVRANVLLRPVLAEYEECFALLSRGKTSGIRKRLERAEHLRGLVTRRASDVADYLNWFEATQMGGRSNVFETFLNTAREADEQERHRRDPIARYLDELEREF